MIHGGQVDVSVKDPTPCSELLIVSARLQWRKHRLRSSAISVATVRLREHNYADSSKTRSVEYCVVAQVG